MISKTGILPKTLDSPIVKEGLRSVATLDDSPHSAGLYLVVGGIAVQSYLPTENRRPTSDIDLCIARPLNYAEFKQFSRSVQEFLRDHGYQVDSKKDRSNFKLIVSKDDKDYLLIEFSRRNQRSFDSAKSRLERELEHGRRKTIQGTDTKYHAASPEDITIPKLVRGIGTLERQPHICPEVAEVFGNAEHDLVRVLQYVIGQRAVAQASGESEQLDQSRLQSDLYDIASLSTFVGFNDDYLAQVVAEWDKAKIKSTERDFLFSLTNIRL